MLEETIPVIKIAHTGLFAVLFAERVDFIADSAALNRAVNAQGQAVQKNKYRETSLLDVHYIAPPFTPLIPLAPF